MTCVGWHACKKGDRCAAAQPISMGLARLYGSTAAGVARGLSLRMDHGTQYLSEYFSKQIAYWGIQPSYAFVEQPQTNGVAERFNRTLKEQIIHGRNYRNIDELRDAVREFVETYNALWLVEKNGYLSPAEAHQAWDAAISRKGRRMTQTCVQGTGCSTSRGRQIDGLDGGILAFGTLGEECYWSTASLMVRLHMVVEGRTEETFVNGVLRHHLAALNVFADARCVETSRTENRIRRGGVSRYRKIKQDISLWMKEDRNTDAYFTTMFDLYGLPDDFPEFAAARRDSPQERAGLLEEAFEHDLNHRRFIPYIQVHEFEALLFSDRAKFDAEFFGPGLDRAINKLIGIASKFETPEDIDDGRDTAPAKRIEQVIPEYGARKAAAGPRIAAAIGIPVMRERCRHFAAWLTRLESLARSGTG